MSGCNRNDRVKICGSQGAKEMAAQGVRDAACSSGGQLRMQMAEWVRRARYGSFSMPGIAALGVPNASQHIGGFE